MHRIVLLVAAALVVAGCGDTSSGAGTAGAGGDGSGGSGGDTSPFVATLEHAFDPIPVESGAEEYWCQSWTIGNDETLYVNKVRQVNNGGWHHSNWFFVPEEQFGEDGTWKCRDRDFDEVAAAIYGGVIFAQSTQTFEEVQAFPEGTAVVVPPHSKIIGNVHLLNVAAGPIESSLTMGLQSLEEEEVEVKLREVSFANYAIAIPPQRRSRWTQTCDISEHVGESYNIYYVLGHFHQWGDYFKLSFVDDDGNESPIVELENTAGDALGVTIDPPLNSQGAGRLKYECGYNNTTDRELHWGNNGEEEMCQFLAYVDADKKIGVFPEGNVPELTGETEGGMMLFDPPCEGGLQIGF